MGHQLPFYKYLNSGANIPQQVGVIGDRLDRVNRSTESQTERVFGSEGVQTTETRSASSTPPPVQLPSLSLPLVKVTLPTPNTTGEFSFGEVRLPEGPPTRSPIPPGWSYCEPVTDNSDLSSGCLVSANTSPLNSPPRQEVKVITRNPSVSAPTSRHSSVSDPAPGQAKSQSAPSSPTCPADCPPLPSRRWSPFLGITALGGFSRESSRQSLEWDNYASSPTFHTRTTPIPVVSTPSTSLDSTPGRASFLQPTNSQPADKMSANQDMLNASVALQIAKNKVDRFISMLIPGKVKVAREDLKEVWDKYIEFSDLMCNFSMTYSGVTEDVPVSNAGEQMTTAWWQQVEKNLLDKVTNHRIQVEAAAVHQTATVDQATALTEFEKRDLEIKLKHLALVEENKKKSEEAERTKVETERIKANAVAQSK